MTFTLEIPEEIAAVLLSVPVARRNAYAVAALRRGTGIEPLATMKRDNADFEESCAAIAQSVAQIETGETVSLEDCKARFAAKRAARLAEQTPARE